MSRTRTARHDFLDVEGVQLTPLVLKFGGSAFADLDGYLRVAQYAAERFAEQNLPMVIVASAMSGTTGRLKEIQSELASEPPAESAAMLLTTGETVSVALLASALDAAGLPARAVPAAGTGLLAEGPADRAELVAADPRPLREALENCLVAVVPGGQAVDEADQTVMLGRNSSDLSAVALAGALGSPVCELFSDVPGVCTADPYLIPEARTLERVSYAGVRAMSRNGAKVVHQRAVDWAERTGVRLHCRPLPPSTGSGTIVGAGPASPSVVVHRSREVWRFPSAAERAEAVGALRGEGVESIEVEEADGTPHLVVPDEIRGLAELLGAHASKVPGRCLVTTLHEDGGAQHTLVPSDEADAEARRRHRTLYPGAPGAPEDPQQLWNAEGSPEPSGGGKRRSRHSEVLFSRGE